MHLPLILLSLACTNRISGKVDGESVTTRDAVFDEVEYDIPLIGSVQVAVVLVTGMPDACAVLEAAADIGIDTCDDYCRDFNDVYEEYLGQDEYWNLWITVNAGDGELVDSYEHDSDFGEDEFVADMDLWDMRVIADLDTCEDECSEGDSILPIDSDQADGGEVVIDSFEDDRMTGDFDIQLGASDEIGGRFRAERCDLSAYLWFL